VFISQDRQTNSGLLVMRLGLAAVLLVHSLPKLFAGSPSWQSVGTTLDFINVGVPVAVLGFVMLLLEALGAVSLVFGYFFPDCLYHFVYYFWFIFFQLFPDRLPDVDAVVSRTCGRFFRPYLCGAGAVYDSSQARKKVGVTVQGSGFRGSGLLESIY